MITELETGGAERCCYELAKHLRTVGHDARIIAFGPFAVPPKDEILLRARAANIPVFSLNTPRWYQFPMAWVRLQRLIRQSRPDIAQSFMWHANVLAASLYPSFGVPLVGGNRVKEPNPKRHRSGAWAASKMRQVVAVSQEVATWTQEIERVPLDKIEVIPNGIDLPHWDHVASAQREDGSKRPSPIPSTSPILLFVGRLNHQKGIDVLAPRIPRILNQLPNHHLVFLGDGPYRTLLQQEVDKSPSRDRIHLLGVRDDVNYWMHRSQLLLLPSRYEGMPNVILEAMASRLPVATLQVEGVEALLGNSVSEQSVPKEEWDRWEALVLQLALDESKCRLLGGQNRQRAEAEFPLVKQLQRYEELYSRIVRGP